MNSLENLREGPNSLRVINSYGTSRGRGFQMKKTKRTERLGENQSMVWEWSDKVKSELVKPSSELAPPPS